MRPSEPARPLEIGHIIIIIMWVKAGLVSWVPEGGLELFLSVLADLGKEHHEESIAGAIARDLSRLTGQVWDSASRESSQVGSQKRAILQSWIAAVVEISDWRRSCFLALQRGEERA